MNLGVEFVKLGSFITCKSVNVRSKYYVTLEYQRNGHCGSNQYRMFIVRFSEP